MSACSQHRELADQLERLMAEGRADHVILGRMSRARRRLVQKRALRRVLRDCPGCRGAE